MAINITQLFAPAQLTASAATYYTVPTLPTNITLKNLRVRFANTDTASHSVTVYAIQSGGTASAANCVANNESIAPNTHLDLDIPMLAAAGFLQAKADTVSVVTISCLDGVLFS